MTARFDSFTARFVAVLLAVALLFTSCGEAATPTPPPPTVEPTHTAAPPLPPPATATAAPLGDTPVAPTAPPPTLAPEPTAPPQIRRIEFAPGMTWSVVQGSLAAGGIDEYILRALAGQSMMVTVQSPDNSVVLEIYGVSDGQSLLRSEMRHTSWQVILLTTQDYSIKAVSIGSATRYTLQVIIPPLTTYADTPPGETPVPPQVKRIQFASDATSAVVQGSLPAEGIEEYLLQALAGQWMMAMVSSPDDSIVLEIWGTSDGQPLVRSHMRQTFWQGPLPATQDYGVKVVSTAGATSYTLQVIIPERIQFAPGAISATDQGSLGPRQTHEYLLRALQGQTMTVTIMSPSNLVLLEIYGIDDGLPLVRVPMGQTTWTGVLPNTQDYDIKAVSVTDVATAYTIEFTVQ